MRPERAERGVDLSRDEPWHQVEVDVDQVDVVHGRAIVLQHRGQERFLAGNPRIADGLSDQVTGRVMPLSARTMMPCSGVCTNASTETTGTPAARASRMSVW